MEPITKDKALFPPLAEAPLSIHPTVSSPAHPATLPDSSTQTSSRRCIICKRELPIRMFFSKYSQHGDQICRDCFAEARLKRQAARRKFIPVDDIWDVPLAHPVGEAHDCKTSGGSICGEAALSFGEAYEGEGKDETR